MVYRWGQGDAVEYDPWFTSTGYFVPFPDGGIKQNTGLGYKFRTYPAGTPLCNNDCIGTQNGAGGGLPGAWVNIQNGERGECTGG